jgi:hypothetical protein
MGRKARRWTRWAVTFAVVALMSGCADPPGQQRLESHDVPRITGFPSGKSGAPPDEIRGTALASTWKKVASQSWSSVARPTYSLSVAPDGQRVVVGVPATMPRADVARLRSIDPHHIEVIDADLRRN